MRTASLTFLTLLALAHLGSDLRRQLSRPLSMFRDGDQAALGYALFATLFVVALLYCRALARARREVEAGGAVFVVLLFVLVAVTPSTAGFHHLCSLLLLGTLFLYYALLLRASDSPWLLGHLAVPILLAMVTQLHSYGLWQKSLVVYFLMLANVRRALIRSQPVSPEPLPYRRYARGSSSPDRRQVYRMEGGRAWARRACG